MARKDRFKCSAAQCHDLLLVIKSIAQITHVIGFMLLGSILISLYFGESQAIIPLSTLGVATLGVSQLVYRFIKADCILHLQNTFISMTFAWIVSIGISAVTFWWLAYTFEGEGSEPLRTFLNALFEGVSANTSTGLTLVTFPEKLPYTLQWLRSFFEWVGGLGLAILVFAFLGNSWSRFAIQESVTVPTLFQVSTKKTIQYILSIYTFYTAVIAVLFYIFGMEGWACINYAMGCLSTGGLAISHESFETASAALKWVAIVGMLLGSVSFTFHYRIFNWKQWKHFQENHQHTLYFFILAMGVLLLLFLPVNQYRIEDIIFQWVSAVATCGLRVLPVQQMPAYTLFILMFGMVAGGCMGSTAGGLKMRRLANIGQMIWNKISILNFREKEGGAALGQALSKKENLLLRGEAFVRLYKSVILFCLWLFTLFLGWGILIFLLPEFDPFKIGFETISALSNVGLSAKIISASSSAAVKWTFMWLMFLGRIEIIPFLATIAAIFPFSREGRNCQ